jgi:hypothetical protein
MTEEGSKLWPQAGSACGLLHAGFLFDLLFEPDDGGDVFFRNIG